MLTGLTKHGKPKRSPTWAVSVARAEGSSMTVSLVSIHGTRGTSGAAEATRCFWATLSMHSEEARTPEPT